MRPAENSHLAKQLSIWSGCPIGLTLKTRLRSPEGQQGDKILVNSHRIGSNGRNGKYLVEMTLKDKRLINTSRWQRSPNEFTVHQLKCRDFSAPPPHGLSPDVVTPLNARHSSGAHLPARHNCVKLTKLFRKIFHKP